MRRQRPHKLEPANYANAEEQFHLILRAHPRFDTWPLPVRDAIWQAVMNERERNSVRLLAACLMPDHLHLLVAPNRLGAIRFADGFKSWTTRQAWSAGTTGVIWQPSFWDRALREQQDMDDVAEYIVRNPVAAGLVEDERAWPFTWVYRWEED